MHVLLITIGTAGDVLPIIGLGRALRGRGHGVTVAVNDRFAAEVTRSGLQFESLGTDSEWRTVYENPLWYDHQRGMRFFTRTAILPLVKTVRTLIEAHQPRDELVVAAAPQVLGARIANVATGIPTAYLYLQPSTLRSILPDAELRATTDDSELALQLSGLLRQLDGLYGPTERSAIPGDGNRELHLGLFPEWYALPQADWPASVRFSGFPLFDGSEAPRLSDDAREFLGTGTRPVLINPGSNVNWVRDYCRDAVRACEELGVRAALLTRYEDQMPERHGAGVRHFPYLPLGEALGYASAMLHHGGISTVGQCFAAGVPQLIRPLGYDHPYNGRAIEQLGVGLVIPPADATQATIKERLALLLGDGRYATRATAVAGKMAATNRLDAACDAIESLHPTVRAKFG